jgi:hypothetical protein
MKKILLLSLPIIVCFLSGCATLTEDAMTPIAISFSDGSAGKVTLTNKRGVWETKVPSTISVRKSDDGLKYEGTTSDGRRAVGVIPSEMGAKIVASAVFIDFGITDAVTDKHRKYPPSYVMPIDPLANRADSMAPSAKSTTTEERLAELERLRKSGMLSDEEYANKRKAIIDNL